MDAGIWLGMGGIVIQSQLPGGQSHVATAAHQPVAQVPLSPLSPNDAPLAEGSGYFSHLCNGYKSSPLSQG